jgi:hypothetical protein
MEQDPDRIARRLTHDELRAAEDAFQGRPLNEACSRAAWRVYVGILVAKNKLHRERSTLGRPAPNHELLLLSMEDLVGAAAQRRTAHGGDGEGFNGV